MGRSGKPEVGEGEELKTSDQFHQTQVNFGLFCDYDVLTPTETINTTPYSRVWIISPSWNLENLPQLAADFGITIATEQDSTIATVTDVQNVQSTVGGRVAVYTTVLSGFDRAAITESNSGGAFRFRTKTRLGTSLFSPLLLNAFDRLACPCSAAGRPQSGRVG